MTDAFICDGIRTPIGRFGGALSAVRADDLAAIPLKALMERNLGVDWAAIDDVVLGSANQAGEDNRNVARMATLLAGLPTEVPGTTLNRLCGSGMDAALYAARMVRCGEGQIAIAGGVESMSRAPFVMPKADSPFSRKAEIYDTTIGWRFVNPLIEKQYGIDSMPETAENVAEQFGISREDQDRFAVRSQEKAVAAQGNGRLAAEIVPVTIPGRKGAVTVVEQDEHPRAGTTLEALAKLGTPFRKEGGTVTAGNASGVNDGAAAMLIASEEAARLHGLTPRARIVAGAVAGVEPRIMGMGPAPATRKVLALAGLTLDQIDVIELNEAFAAQGLAVLRDLGLADDDPRVNPNGGAIALGHPLGMSGARLLITAAEELQRTKGRYALCTMCIGVGQGIATIIERV
ncbi:3-oxoadipyl-CoA thiolase [Pedomonas mirosovicensis]|uniref:3-oxoadipyl-CoA thiolase n=1 Tax=Pedomonas mirosovicensis TaxID=2908641 RepID=UPI00216724DD|nr:3-oxoadipyl-CoA thiolase [Pedomonas mirosovicensis]MCH8684516.1 3-oxoadipyl-CoA thiolase [Pedomonas mirosovicensis]